MKDQTEPLLLKAVLEQYATPDPKIVGTIPRNGQALSYVSHAEITRILIEIDPMWNWQPAAWIDGRPAMHESNGTATMWATLTLLGKSLVGVGSVRADKPDYEKELIGDFLRNASMRFGICLSLWSKQEMQTSKPNSTYTSYPAKMTDADFSKQAHPANVTQISSPQDALSDAQIADAFTGSPKPVTKIGSVITDKQKGLISALGKEVADGDVTNILGQLFNKTNLNTLTTKEGSELIKHLMSLRKPEEPF